MLPKTFKRTQFSLRINLQNQFCLYNLFFAPVCGNYCHCTTLHTTYCTSCPRSLTISCNVFCLWKIPHTLPNRAFEDSVEAIWWEYLTQKKVASEAYKAKTTWIQAKRKLEADQTATNTCTQSLYDLTFHNFVNNCSKLLANLIRRRATIQIHRLTNTMGHLVPDH